MKKSFLVVLALMAFLAAALVGSAAWAQKTKSGEVKDDLSIQDPILKPHTKAAVQLTHKKHSEDYKVACTECHHVYKDKKNVWKEGDKVQKCSECHKSPKANEGEMLSLYNAFHKNCRTCHTEKKKGPTKCDECHPKK